MAGEVQGISSRLKVAGAAIAGAFSLHAVGGALDTVIEKTSRIADGAARIGVSAEAFQKLSFAAQQSGGSMQAIETSMRVMADRITDGKLPAALTQMGLSVEKLRAMTPDQAFLAIAGAVARIPDPMLQSSTAVDIFGRGAQAILPAIKAGFADVAATAPVMSNAMIASADQMGDKWAAMQLQIDNLRAQALLPLMNGFMQLPTSMQMAGAGIVSLLPILEPLILALIAIGGPGKALALVTGGFTGLATFFTATLPGAIGAVIPFFTTTLPAAFTAVIAFLGPQGLIALAVIALAAVWYKWGDQISAIVQQVYTAIKTWLVDKFNAIVASIKGKIDAVTGYFKGMYQAVVGGSYVPDMIEGIRGCFGQLDEFMVRPAQTAASMVESIFASLASKVGGFLGGLLSKIPGIGGLLGKLGIGNGIGGLLGKAAGALGLSGLFGGGSGAAAGVSGVASAIGGGGAAGGGFMASMGGLLTNPWTIGIGAAIGGGLLLQKLMGPSEAYKTLEARSAWEKSIGAGTANDGLAAIQQQTHGNPAMLQAYNAVYAATSRDDLNHALTRLNTMSQQDGGGETMTGAGGVQIHNHISTIDWMGVRDFVESDAFTASLNSAMKTNKGFIASSVKRVAAET